METIENDLERWNQESLLIRDFVTAQGQAFELPPLRVEEVKPGWFSELVRQMVGWLEQFFPSVSPSSLPQTNVQNILLFMMAIVILGILFWLVRYFIRSSRRQPGRISEMPESIGTSERQAYQLLLQEALDQGRLDEWARLRWHLFLNSLDLSSALTPLDFLDRHPRLEPVIVQSLYRLMFSADSVREDIAKVDRYLLERESQR